MKNNAIRIGLFGFGTVGEGLYEVLKKATSAHAEIVKICVRDRNKKRSLPAEIFTYEPEDIFTDPDINLVVELIDDADASYAIVRRSLEAGKAVVSGNKKMLAYHIEELIELQEKTDKEPRGVLRQRPASVGQRHPQRIVQLYTVQNIQREQRL